MQLTMQQTKEVVECLSRMYKICTGNELFHELEIISKQLEPLGIDYKSFVELSFQEHMSVMAETMQKSIEDMKLNASKPEFLESLRNQVKNAQELRDS